MSRKLSMSLSFVFLVSVLAGCTREAAPAASPTAAHPVVCFTIDGHARAQGAPAGRADQTASAPPMRMGLWSEAPRDATTRFARPNDKPRRAPWHHGG